MAACNRPNQPFRMEQWTDISGFATAAALEPVTHESVDDELVEAVRSGDEAAFALLF